MKQKRHFTLDADVLGMLERVGERNGSAYLEGLIRMRWREWQDALATLRAHGWSSGEILSACDALNGYALLGPGRAPSAIALELHDYARIRGLRQELDVSPERWQERVRQVAEDPTVAASLVSVTTEFWIGNEAIEHAIRRAGEETP